MSSLLEIHSVLQKTQAILEVMDIFPGRFLFSSHFGGDFQEGERTKKDKNGDEQQNSTGINESTNLALPDW